MKFQADDLFMSPLDQAQIDFANEGARPISAGTRRIWVQRGKARNRNRIWRAFRRSHKGWKSLDYVAGWFMKAADYGLDTPTVSAFVTTNSICQGQQVPVLWPLIFKAGHEIAFAHTSLKWANLASHNAGVTVAIVAISNNPRRGGSCLRWTKMVSSVVKEAENINGYLDGRTQALMVNKDSTPISGVGAPNGLR